MKNFILGLLCFFLVAQVSYVTKGVYLTDSTGSKVDVVSGNLSVLLADQDTPAIAIKFSRTTAAFTSLDANASVDDTTVSVASTTGAVVGQRIGIFGGATRFFFATILSVGAGSITFDTPLDFAFTSGSGVAYSNTDISDANGSLVSPVIYEVPNSAQIGSGAVIDVTRLMFKVKCSTTPEFDEFCDISGGLTNGIVLRKKVNGVATNYWNIKKNSDFSLLAYDLQLYDSSPPLNINGVTSRLTYGGQSKHGVVIRLQPQESLQLIVQDDLTSLVDFEIMVEGHYTTDILN